MDSPTERKSRPVGLESLLYQRDGVVHKGSSPTSSKYAAEADVHNLLSHVLSPLLDQCCGPDKPLLNLRNFQFHLEQFWKEVKGESGPSYGPVLDRAINDGRIGALKPVLVREGSHGELLGSSDRLQVESLTLFSSVRANVCVCKGKWQYEVLLGSSGVMQIGWCSVNSKFTHKEGVGDTADSFAYDGHRVRRWNGQSYTYGEEWASGDIIGCCLDMDEGEMTFFKNGRSMGVAFSNISTGPGVALFPALTLSFTEHCRLNFGNRPLQYPQPGYRPLQDPPTKAIRQGTCLLNCLHRLHSTCGSSHKLHDAAIGHRMLERLRPRLPTLRFVLGAHLWHYFVTAAENAILYVVDGVVLPFFLDLCDASEPFADQSHIADFLDMMWATQQEKLLLSLFTCLISYYYYSPLKTDFSRQVKSLMVALALFKHTASRKYIIMELKGLFEARFPYLLHLNSPDTEDLKELIPVVWWDGCSEQEGLSKARLAEAQERLRPQLAVLEALQIDLCKTWLTYSPEDTASAPYSGTDTATGFVQVLRSLVKTNLLQGSHPRSGQQHQCPQSVLSSLYFRLLPALRYHLQKSHGNDKPKDFTIPSSSFTDNDLVFYDVSRVGGLFSHVKKEFADELKAEEEREDSDEEDESSLKEVRPELIEVMDRLFMLYMGAIHKQLTKVHSFHYRHQQYLRTLQENKAKLAEKQGDVEEEVIAQFRRSEEVFTNECVRFSRMLSWAEMLVLTESKRDNVNWMFMVISRIIHREIKRGALFSILPGFYINVLLEAFHDMRLVYHPTVDFFAMEGQEQTVANMADLLCQLHQSEYIVAPDLKDSIMLELTVCICLPDVIAAVEALPEAILKKTFHALLTSFSNPSWVKCLLLLLRIWWGCGFANRKTSVENIISQLTEGVDCEVIKEAVRMTATSCHGMQQILGEICVEDEKLCTEFLNGLLNQLNWAFSELVGAMQQIQQAASDHAELDVRQLHTCTICFELTVGLLKVVEMVVTVAPKVWLDRSQPTSEIMLPRLFQLLGQVLQRVMSRGGLVEKVAKQRLPIMDTINRSSILKPVLGVLLALTMKCPDLYKERARAQLRAESGLQVNSLQQLLGMAPMSSGSEQDTSVLPSTPAKKTVSSLAKLRKAGDVNADEMEQVERFIAMVMQRFTATSPQRELSTSLSEDLCAICYAQPLSVVFVPCGHESCRTCITYHMMNDDKCFFCKEVVEQISDIAPSTPSAESAPPTPIGDIS